ILPRTWTHLAFVLQIAPPAWKTGASSDQLRQISVALFVDGEEVERDFFAAANEPMVTKCVIGSKGDQVFGLQGYVAYFAAHYGFSRDALALRRRQPISSSTGAL